MKLRHIESERRREWHNLLRSLIPKPLRDLLRLRSYQTRFPSSAVSYRASLNLANPIVLEGGNIISPGVNISVAEFHLGRYSTLSGPSQIVGLGRVSIGRYCSIAPNVYIVTNNHNHRRPLHYPLGMLTGSNRADQIIEDVTIGHDVWVGRGATILPGARISDGCIVAAGAVVTKGTYPPYSILAGVPAAVVKARFSPAEIARVAHMQVADLEPEDIPD